MQIHNVQQGSQEWHDLRASADGTASEAPAMMGESKYQSRDDLLQQKVTGEVKEISPHQQKIFDQGHEAEEKARPIVEGIIGEELFPVTGSIEIEGLHLLASCDGLTMLEDQGWEHKLWNQSLAESVADATLDPHYYWQLEQQLLVTGAEKILFTTSNGTEDYIVHMEYFPIPGRREQLIAGWKQFAKDLAEYQPAVKVVKPEADAIKELPAIIVQISGGVQHSNLPAFKEQALAFIESIPTELETDQDFANAEKTVKYLDESEKKIELVKKQALEQTADISELFRVMDEIKDTMRSTRLNLNKQVSSQKETRKRDMIKASQQKLDDHIADLNEGLGDTVTDYMPHIPSDFAGAIKNKRSLENMQGALNDELARAKIEANQLAEKITRNLEVFNSTTKGYEALFADKNQLVLGDSDHLELIISDRIRKHDEAQEAMKVQQEQEVQAKAEQGPAAPEAAPEKANEEQQISSPKDPRIKEIAKYLLANNHDLSDLTAYAIAVDLIAGVVPYVYTTKAA